MPFRYGDNMSAPVCEVAHAELTRAGESPYRSRCPKCGGMLLGRRDPEAGFLLADDSCIRCGQRYRYTDAQINGEPVGRPRTLAEIGTTEAVLIETAETMRSLLAAWIGIPESQIVVCEFSNIDEAMPGKVALRVDFHPKLNPQQIKVYMEAVGAIAALGGSRPPIFSAPGSS